MKKLAIVLVIVGMIVLDLVLSGMNVLLGLLLIASAALLSYLMDLTNRQPRRTTSLSQAARRNRELQETMTKAELRAAA